MDYTLVFTMAPEGETPATCEPPEPRHAGDPTYVGEAAAWVAEDETILEASRIERIGTK
jgi:hypothetical protein